MSEGTWPIAKQWPDEVFAMVDGRRVTARHVGNGVYVRDDEAADDVYCCDCGGGPLISHRNAVIEAGVAVRCYACWKARQTHDG